MPTILLKTFLAATWAADNPVLLHGEPGLESDTGRLKIGANSAHWNDLPYVDALSGVVQVVDLHDGTYASGTTTIPIDNTIPHITEGDEYMSLSITPKKSTNKLRIDVYLFLSANTPEWIQVALFKDDLPDAIATVLNYDSPGGGGNQITLSHVIDAGSTSPQTFSVRAGVSLSGTLSFNGPGGAFMGGTIASSIIITEYKL